MKLYKNYQNSYFFPSLYPTFPHTEMCPIADCPGAQTGARHFLPPPTISAPTLCTLEQ